MKKRLVAGILIVCSLSILLCGCQKSDVDYDMDTQEESTTQETSPLTLESMENWTEAFMVSENENVSINATVRIPDVEQMSVTELQNIAFSEEYKKKVIQQLYGTLEVYSNEEKDWTKDRWQTLINITERSLKTEENLLSVSTQNNDEAGIKSCKNEIERLQKELQECTEKMNKAPETVEAVSDFSGDNYVGTYNGMNYELSFYEDKNNSFSFEIEDRAIVGPEDIKDCGTLMFAGFSPDNAPGENLCTITEDEAKELAEAVMRTVGWTEFVWQETKVIVWGGDDGIETNIFTDGYCFTCQKGVDDFVFGEFDTGYEMLGEKEYLYAETANIFVNDHGIISIEVENPVNFVQETEKVSLLSLDTIKGVIKKELNEHPDKYLSGDTTYFSELELNYVRINDKSRQGYYSYVPAWRLCNKVGSGDNREVSGYPVMVNAMDGSVIYLEDVVNLESTEE